MNIFSKPRVIEIQALRIWIPLIIRAATHIIILGPKNTFLADRELLKLQWQKTQFRDLIEPWIEEAITVPSWRSQKAAGSWATQTQSCGADSQTQRAASPSHRVYHIRGGGRKEGRKEETETVVCNNHYMHVQLYFLPHYTWSTNG